jgi:hypothetical protein
MSAQRYYSIGYVAHHLGCDADDVMRLINDGTIDADANVSGDVLVIEEAQVERAKDALKTRSEQGDES